jgi:uncharacterized protein
VRQCAANIEVVCLARSTLMSYLRMTMHPRIFAQPMSRPDAMRNVKALTALPHCRVIGEQEGFRTTYLELAGDLSTWGDLVPDAHLAAVLRQSGITTLYTHDRDFRKFAFLYVRDPLAH